MIREALAGLGLVAYGDPPPSPGFRGSMSYSPNQQVGRIRLVSSRGVRREATYQMIYESNPFVYAATNYIARGIGRLPLHIIELDRNGEKQRVRADLPGPLPPQARVDRILNQPAGRISRAAFYGGTMRQRLVLGNALWELLRPSGVGFPEGIRRIPWTNVVHVEEDGYGGALWYELQEPGTQRRRRRLAADDVVHFGLGTEGSECACGVSLLESCSATLALHDVLLRHVLGYFENSARPSGHVSMEKASPEKVREMRELLTALYASPENAGRIIVTSGKWEPMSDSPEQSGIVELLKQSRIEIAAAWQVPPPILGLLENAIRANVKELREQFGRDTIGPWATETEDELEAQLIKQTYPNLQSEFQLAEQLRPDLEARALVYQRLMWVMSIDEIRQTENMPPLKIKGVTDVPWVASGAMPVTNAAKTQPRSPGGVASPPAAEDGGPTLLQAAELVRLADAVALNGNAHHDE